MILIVLFAVLGLASAAFIFAFAVAFRRNPARPTVESIALGAVTNFFDALGIGCFAPSTAYLKFRRLVPDELIAPTMICGYALGAVAESYAFIGAIKVDPILLGLAIGASAAGAMLGVSVASRLAVRPIRVTLGAGLLIASAIYALSNLGLTPAGGAATSLPPPLVGLVVAAGFGLGVLMNLGIGNYAPTLILVSLLGMDPRAAFPIMMGSAALLMVASGTRILRLRRLDLGLVLGMTLGSVPAVLVAAYIVKSLPLSALRWGVVVAVTYAGVVMLRAAMAPAPRPADAATA